MSINIEEIRQRSKTVKEAREKAERKQAASAQRKAKKKQQEWEESHHEQFKAEIEQCIRAAAEAGRFACKWEYRSDNRPEFRSLMEKIEKEFPGFDFAEELATEWWNHYVISWEEA